MCKECDKKKRNEYNTRVGKSKHPVLLKVKNREKLLQFQNRLEARRFILYRRLQAVGYQPPAGHCSRVGQKVERLIAHRDAETGEIKKHYEHAMCSECGGHIVFDERGFKVCVDCGLLDMNFTLENEIWPGHERRVLRPGEYYSRAIGDYVCDEDENFNIDPRP